MATSNRRPSPEASQSEAKIELSSLLRQGVTLQANRAALLKESLASGLGFFDRYNDARLALAFSYFDQSMREAFYEILFLLHTNTPELANLKATPARGSDLSRAEEGQVFNLYSEGCPAGVAGVERLSKVYREDFVGYVRKVFNAQPAPANGKPAPFVMLQSIGSIGTVGHKSTDSDLDLQVIYNLSPALPDAEHWNNGQVLDAMRAEYSWWVAKLPAMQKLTPDKAAEPAVQQQMRAKAEQTIAGNYPGLYAYLWKGGRSLETDMASGDAAAIRTRLLQELVGLIKRTTVMANESATRKLESALKARVANIEKYAARRFPDAEVHLFTYPIVGYRLGRYSSTLESKESSGSAYELLLNYETLMPGIHLTPMVPTHFIFPTLVNNDSALYSRLMDYIQFDLIDVYRDVKGTLVDLGNTPNVEAGYVARHSGAMYWEAFKASSGNLPKSALNLLRYEMMLEPRLLRTNIQIIKEPGLLDGLAPAKGEDVKSELQQMQKDLAGLPAWAVLEQEVQIPTLRQDPWWLRYKALKLGFGVEKGVPGLEPEERCSISRVIDLAFALHVRISDVLTKPGDTRKFETPRERMLVSFLQRTFPAGSLRRQNLEQIFAGEVEQVNRFELDLRTIFKRSMARVTKKIADFKLPDRGWKREEDLWYQYYLSHFDPPPNVVLRTIMSHLRVPRGRLQIGFKPGQGWFFRSLQKGSSVGKRFDTFGMLNHLPDTVMLLEKSAFLTGVAHCVRNGYLGVVDGGTLRERRTELEFDAKFMNMGQNLDNTLAFVRPDMLQRIVKRIEEFFPYLATNYTDFIDKPRRVTGVMAFLNVWRFGTLGLMYRDNLNTWYCDEIDHPIVVQQAKTLSAAPAAMLSAKPIHATLAGFFKQREIDLEETAFTTWVNPMSVMTSHAIGQEVAKERQLSMEFERIVRRLHGKNGPYALASAAQSA
jgi:hypothetical protein